MRFVVEILPVEAQRVEGTLIREGFDHPVPFCGWLELLRLLQPVQGARPSLSPRVPLDQSASPGPGFNRPRER